MAEPRSLRERFYELVHKEDDENGHWIWLGRKMQDDWGPRLIFDLGSNRKGDNRIVIASRFAYEDAHGVSLKGQKLKRLCSNKMCVNPAHFTPWLQARADRNKLLEVATMHEDRISRRDAQRRQERMATYLAMHWAKGVAKELVRQRALLASIVESNQKLIAELVLSRLAAESVDRYRQAVEERDRTSHTRSTLVDVFLSTVPGAIAGDQDEKPLAIVLDRAIALRIGEEGSTKEAIDLFRSWLRRFAFECASGERTPTVSDFAAAVNLYESSPFGSLDLPVSGSNTSPTL